MFLLQVLLTVSDGEWFYRSLSKAILSVGEVLLQGCCWIKATQQRGVKGVKYGYSTDPKGREGYSAQPLRGSCFMWLLPLPSVKLGDTIFSNFVFPYDLIKGCIVPAKERKLLFRLTLSRQEKPVQIK